MDLTDPLKLSHEHQDLLLGLQFDKPEVITNSGDQNLPYAVVIDTSKMDVDKIKPTAEVLAAIRGGDWLEQYEDKFLIKRKFKRRDPADYNLKLISDAITAILEHRAAEALKAVDPIGQNTALPAAAQDTSPTLPEPEPHAPSTPQHGVVIPDNVATKMANLLFKMIGKQDDQTGAINGYLVRVRADSMDGGVQASLVQLLNEHTEGQFRVGKSESGGYATVEARFGKMEFAAALRCMETIRDNLRFNVTLHSHTVASLWAAGLQ